MLLRMAMCIPILGGYLSDCNKDISKFMWIPTKQTELIGNSYYETKSLTLEECQSQCNTTWKCRWIVYNSENMICYEKLVAFAGIDYNFADNAFIQYEKKCVCK